MAGISRLMGLANIQRRFDKIPKEIKNQVKKKMAQEADYLVGQMKAAVPVDTGALRSSIKWTWGRPDKKDTVLGEVKSALGGEMVITIYAGYTRHQERKGKLGRELPIARFVEFGTDYMVAQPFFYPVWRGHRKKARANVRKSVGKAIKAATK